VTKIAIYYDASEQHIAFKALTYLYLQPSLIAHLLEFNLSSRINTPMKLSTLFAPSYNVVNQKGIRLSSNRCHPQSYIIPNYSSPLLLFLSAIIAVYKHLLIELCEARINGSEFGGSFKNTEGISARPLEIRR
jgi:hypothetical protein